MIIVVGTNSITLNEAAGKNININNKRSVIGESTEGGTTTFTTLPSLWNDGVKIIRGTNDNDYMPNCSFNSVMIYGLAGNDSIDNHGHHALIDGGDGKDAIESWGDSVTIDGGDDKDYIKNYGLNISINGGAGNDVIYNYYGQSVTINAGDGDDVIDNNHGANVTIDGGAGNDFIDNSSLSWNVKIDGGDGNDSIHNYGSDSVTIDGGDGNDSIENCDGDSVTIDGGKGDDTINLLYGTTNLIQYASGDGNDIIQGFKLADTLSISGGSYSSAKSGNDVILTVGDGKISLTGAASLSMLNIIGTYEDDTTHGGDTTPAALSIANTVNNTLIIGSEFADTIKNSGSTVTIDAGTGNDSIANVGGLNISINGGAGNDSIINVYFGSNITIDGGDGNDTVSNTCAFVTINGGAGNNSIYNQSANVKINGGANDDFIITFNGGDTISGNTGDDQISLSSYAKNVFIEYALGDGNDSIRGFNATDSLEISGGSYSSAKRGNDVILTVGDGKISLVGAASLSTLNIIGTYTSDTTPPDTTPADTTLTVTNADKSPVTLESSIEVVDASTRTKAVKIFGNALDNTITGGKGNDTFSGGDGADTFIMSGGKDVIIDYSSEDVIQVTKNVSATFKGNDVIFTVDKNNSLTVKDGAKGQTITLVDEQGETISANTYYADRMVDDDSVILGANFKGKTFKPEDNIRKVDGSALKGKLNLTGNDFDDTLIGGNGADTLNGGAGNDELTGGGGKNIFVYTGGADTITDYKSGKDKISIASGLSIQGVEKVEDGGFMVEFGEDTSLQIDNITRTTKVSLVTTTTVKDKSKAVIATVYFDEGRIFDKPTDIASTKVTVMGGEADFSDDGNYKKLKTITAAENLDGLEIYGNKNANSIVGSAGDDSLWGGDGNDTLCGGDGEDTFIYQISKKSGKETIVDYQDNELLEILDADGNAVDFKNATYGKNKLTLTLENKGSIILTGITSETALNINGETYHVDGKTLSK